MMSTVIPARLEFQCGHAALVSLPRVKGESFAQRTDRIAREKSAAQARACDFCPPPRLEVVELAQAVVVVAAQPAPPAAPVSLPEPVVALPEPVVAVPEPVVVLPEPVVVLPVPPVDVASTNGATPTVKRTARPRRTSAPAAQNGRANSYRFLVRFRTEAVLNATDIRDALRQAESLGATEVFSLTRN